MNYSSLEDAYGLLGNNGIAEANRQAKKEERRKAKRCKGPQLTFLDPSKGPLLDPDRQQMERTPIIPPMNPATGLREHTPVTAPQGSLEPFASREQQDDPVRQRQFELQQRTDDDEEGDEVRNTLPSPKQLVNVQPSSSFFGKDPTADEPFSNYQPDAKNYLMEPSFSSVFNGKPVEGNTPPEGSPATLPIPSVRDVWKPLTPGGANTSYFDTLPRPGGQYPKPLGLSNESLSRKIDTIMERLDFMNKGPSPEQNQTDILLFVSSGIFILFMMDLLVRKGTTTRFLTGL
jgi:hypothetical protein